MTAFMLAACAVLMVLVGILVSAGVPDEGEGLDS